ncbi:hypothetical protein [Aestuariivirga sp.]|uniref:hypothetical protein n=1 Tax=Aestuariivirga sp. TaxID=2650926 RepID=UPI0035947B16
MRNKRGRKSAAQLAVTTVADLIERVERPDAPYDLTDLQAAEWRAIVARMPADWFTRETWPLLTQYCRHIISAQRIAMLLHAMETDKDEGLDTELWLKMLAAQERETRALASIARQLRLSHVSTMRQDRTAKPATEGPKPWEM